MTTPSSAQVRLVRFDEQRLIEVGRSVRDLYPMEHADRMKTRVSDAVLTASLRSGAARTRCARLRRRGHDFRELEEQEVAMPRFHSLMRPKPTLEGSLTRCQAATLTALMDRHSDEADPLGVADRQRKPG
jgi:hypothetical protein